MLAGFVAESFSVYAVVYTVDFHYGDGEYDFSIAGESSIMLSEVMDRLHMEPLYINDVRDAKFSDPDLVKVEKVEGAFDAENGTAPADDWKLTSLKAFDTDEVLTLILNDGTEIEVGVTDAPASSSEFVSVTNQMLVNAKGTTSVPVIYQFANGERVTGDKIGLPVTIPSGAVYNGNYLLGLLNTSTFERNINNAATWNNTVAVQNTSAPWVVDGASKNETQVRLVLKASNGKIYYTKNYYNIGRVTDGNTTTVANEINNNKYMFVDDDYFVVKLVLSRNGSYSSDGITYPTVKNSDMTATATELDADTYGSNMLPKTVSIAGVPYTVVDNITKFKENNVTYSLDRTNLRATVTSGTTTAGTVDVNGTVFVIPRQNEYSGNITYNGVTYTVDTSRTDGAPRADASAYKAATIGAGTNRTITYRNDYGQDTTEPTVVNDITVSIPLSKTIQSSLSKEDLLSELGDKSLVFGVEQGSSNPAGGATVALSDGGSGTDYDLTYTDLLNNGTNTGSEINTVYTLDGNDSPWTATFTKEGAYTFTVSEKETGHEGVSNQSEATALTYYIVEEEGSLRLAEVYKAKNAEIESTKVSEADLEDLDLSKLFNTSFALGSAVSNPPEITASGETITMNLHSDTSGVITTKFTFDFSRSFEIQGQLGTPDSDAVAIAFHGYDALPAYRWDCNNGFDDFHYGNGNARQELRFLRYGYIPPNGDLKKGFLYNILTRDLDSLRGWYAYKVENNVRLPYVASSGLNGDVRNTDGTYNLASDAKSYESFDNHEENWKNGWSPFKIKFTCRDSAKGLGTLEITAMGKTVQFNDFNASDILGADVWQDAHFSLGSSVQNGDSGGLIFSKAEYTDELDSVETTFWADRDHNGVYETKVNTTNSLAVPGEKILVRHKMNRHNAAGELFFENVLIRQLKDNTNGSLLTPTEVVSYLEGDMSTAYEPAQASKAFNTDDVRKGMKAAVFTGQSTILEYKITAPSEYNHTVVESALFGQPPFTSVYTGADGFRTQKELKWATPSFTNIAEDVTVTYNPDGGTFADDTTASKSFDYLKSINCTVIDAPTKEGNIFDGWKLNDSTKYQPGDEFEITEDITLVAQWRTSANLTVTKDADGDYADLTRNYTFEITLPEKAGGYTATRYSSSADTTGSDVTSIGATGGTFELKTGERIVIEGVPLNKAISVTETGMGDISQTGEDGKYKVTPSFTEGSDSTKEVSISGTVASFKLTNDATLNYSNYLNGVVPSGLKIAGGVLALAIIVVLGVLYAVTTRHRRHA